MVIWRYMRNLLSTGILLLLVGGSVAGQQPVPTSITIDIAHTGWSETHHQFVIHVRDGKSYLGNEVIDQPKVDSLLKALREPTLTSPSLENLGISRDWLEQNVAPIPKDGTPTQLSLFRESFCDTETITRLLPQLFKFMKSDDYPSVRITVALAGSQSWVASSESYYPFMLPWKVSVGDRMQTNYNADISRAIAAILPSGSPNRARLNGDELRNELAQDVMRDIEGQWDALGVENLAPESFASLRQQFEVDRARIVPYRGYDFGYRTGDPSPHEENLEATLRQRNSPANVAVEVELLFHDGKVDGVADLAERIPAYQSLVFSVPWLSEYLAAHPDQHLYIRFVHDRSFSRKAMETFEADMRTIGKDALVADVAANQDKAALIFLDYGSDWIVLPDKQMILWRHYKPASFLKWNANDFKIQRCADYNGNGGGCVGAVITPEGELQR